MAEGPDVVVEADRLMTWRRNDPVRLRLEATGDAALTPVSVMAAFEETVKQSPRHTALAEKVRGTWKKYSYNKYYSLVRKTARAFIKLGLEACHGVGIIGFNAPEWFISDLAAIFAGGFATGIYTTNSAEACYYVVDNADCNIVVVENDIHLQKILQVRDKLPNLRAIIQYKDDLKEQYPDVYTWKQMLELGEGEPEDGLDLRIKNQAPNKCCSLIYTSGTTGSPKGAMLSHDNLTWTAKMLIKCAKIEMNQEVVVSYLPLSHIAGQLLDIYLPLLCGGTVYFAQPDALKGSLGVTLKDVRPTLFLGVPRVWEKMQEAMVAVGKSNGGFKRRVAAWAKTTGLEYNYAIMKGRSPSNSLQFGLANKLVFKKVRLALGLDRCRIFVSGAAPIMKETLEFFLSLNIPIMEVYGMSESTGPHTVCLPWCFTLTSVGKEFPGARTILTDPDKDANGEICMGGRHVFMGYLNMEEKTREAVDDKGWLHSGDIGRKDSDGFLYITGRIKELLITAGGENIPPVLIEDRVKEALPCIGNCMLIGDKRKFLSIILTLKSEVDSETMEPLNQLSKPAVEWCRGVGSGATTVTDIIRGKDVKVLVAIQRGIDVANRTATSRAQTIQKWTIVAADFSIFGGELGPTLKLKRPFVLSKYKKTIDAFYEESTV